MIDPKNTLKHCLKDKDPMEWKGYTFATFEEPEKFNWWNSPNTKVLQEMEKSGLVEVEPILGRFRIKDLEAAKAFISQ